MKYLNKPESYYKNADKRLSTRACTVPFLDMEIHQSGKVTLCCQTWLPTPVGNFLTDSAEEILNNADRIRIQENMRNGNFSDCNDKCPFLSQFLHNSIKRFDTFVPIKSLDNAIDTLPIVISLSYDPSCNLQCPSCRNSLIVWHATDVNGQQAQKIHIRVKEMVSLLLEKHPNKKIILSITGTGDPFASPLYWNYLVELCQSSIPKNLLIALHTNGIMMTQETWEEIKPLWPHIQFISVSVDAATEETYNIVRKNGNFKKLQKNLLILDDMISSRCFINLKKWQNNIVVQKDNFKELKLFVEWMLTFKSKPMVWTSLIAQWGHLSNDQFNKMAVWQDIHPDRDELVKVLADPIFYNEQVRLGNLSPFLPKRS
jgi:MoaA/NifB/PqqE/SkfB family radical SAM enzyme